MKSLNTIRMGWRTGGSVHVPLVSAGFENIASRSVHLTCGCQHQTDVKIPNKINRGPTDILRALASTVQRDNTANHYKFHDDPYLLPNSNIEKRTYALAKESGRKAAQWIKNEHPNLFQHHNADPPIAAFQPRAVYNEDSHVDEDTLIKAIQNVEVGDAKKIYELLEKNNHSISPSTRQSLLELLCFYNGQDAISEDFIEQRWFMQSNKGRQRMRPTWNDGGVAEAVFKSIDPSNAAAYCALLRGMTRYCQGKRALLLYQDMQEKGLSLDVETYNSLIRVSSMLYENHDQRWEQVQVFLTTMSKEKLCPTVDTLNAVLEVLSCMTSQRHAKSNAMRTLSEFKLLGVKPTLSTYYYLLIIFYKEGGQATSILPEILNHIDGEAFTPTDPKDTFFFVTAMDICFNHLQDKDLAHRVNRLLHTANNYDLIGDGFKESIYYRHYFTLLCTTEPLDVFMDVYQKLVPNIYMPEPSVVEEVIKAIDLNGAVEHFPRIWSDMVIFGHLDRNNLVEAILNGMVKNQPPEGSPLIKQFADISWEVWKLLEDASDGAFYRKLAWTGTMLGNVMVLCLRGGEFDQAIQVLCKLVQGHHTVVGLPGIESLQLFLDICIIHNKTSNAMACIHYCADVGFPEAGKMAQKLKAALPLDQDQVAKLIAMVGEEALGKEDVNKMAKT